jgi:5-methylcytosine-specific restriction endonuclease McrA
MRANEFPLSTQQQALARQRFKCALCGTRIQKLGNAGRESHKFGEAAHAHHIRHIKMGGTAALGNCAIICWSCHYTAHEGGNYRHGTVVGEQSDFPYFNGSPPISSAS